MGHDPCPLIYEFGDFRFIPSESVLLRDGVPISLPAKALETLLVLVRENGHLVEKTNLINLVWGDVFVEEGNIAGVISTLRKALGDARSKHQYIETVSKRGYRFVAEVRTIETNPGVVMASAPVTEAMSERQIYSGHVPKSTSRDRSPWSVIGVAASVLILVTVAVVARNRVPAFAANPLPPSASTEEAKRAPSSGGADEEARQVYAEGRYYANRGTQEGLRRSVEYFQQAVLRDPQYAEAYAGLADSYSWLAYHEERASEDEYPIAKNAAEKAIELDDSLAESHTALALVHLRYEWDVQKAEREFLRSIELNPKYVLAYVGYTSCLASEGRLDEALEQARRAQEVDPVSAVTNTELAGVYYLNRDYGNAVSILRHVVDLAPDYALAHIKLGIIYTLERHYEDALRESQEVDRLAPRDPRFEGLSGYIEARAGQTSLARARLTRLSKQSEHDNSASFSVATIYLGLNEDEQAVDWLEKSYEERSTSLLLAGADPLFDRERSNPRFAGLIVQLHKLETDK